MWADPARWNAQVVPHIRLSDQRKTLVVFHVFYVENLAPLLFLFLLLAVAPRRSRRAAWWHGWVVYVPAVAGLVAYAMVLVTTRYVMAFVLSGTLVMLATIPVARRLLPLHALFGLVMPVALEAVLPQTVVGLSLVTSVIGGLLAGALVSAAQPLVWGFAATLGLVVTRVLFLPVFPNLLRVGAASLAILFWRATLAAIRGRRPVRFARRSWAALVFLLAVVFVFRLGIRLSQDRDALERASSPAWGNLPWNIAVELASHGITPGTRIALIGPHAESYWARTARLHIVASVPRNRVADFWLLPKASQDSLLAEFAAAGATYAVATLGLVGTAPDSSWTPVKYRGRIKRLTGGR